jgi:hypothetical protein
VILEAKCRDCGETFNPHSEDDLTHDLRDDEQTVCGGQGKLLGGYEHAAADTRQYPFAITHDEARGLRWLIGLETERLVREEEHRPDEGDENTQAQLDYWRGLDERLEVFLKADNGTPVG